MLGFAKRQPRYAEPEDLLPVRRDGALLLEHDRRLVRIRSMVGVPARHWRLLYEALFAAYAQYVQQIPETSHTREPGTLLRHALETVEQALKIRRGYVLPPGKEPEVVANEQDVWTYAVATAALLQRTGNALLSQRVTLYNRNRRPVNVWSPWTGPMAGCGIAYYRVELRPSAASDLTRLALPLLVPHIVPADGLRWLAGHEDALAALLATISGHAPDATVIAEIIRKASPPSHAESVPEEPQWHTPAALQGESSGTADWSENRALQEQSDAAPQPETTLSAEGGAVDPDDTDADDDDPPRTGLRTDGQADDVGDAFLQWLSNGITSGALAVNSPKAHLHVVDAGLLLASPAVFRAFSADNWREVQKRFLKQKLTAKAAGGENVFRYRQAGNKGRKTIKGMLIRNPEKRLGMALPAVNPQLVPAEDSR